MEDIRGKHVSLSIEDPDTLYRYAHALASPVRIRIMKTLGERSMNVGELAQKMEIPMSSAALAVKILEEAGFAIRQPGCSACLAMNDDKIPAGKYVVSTSNRNFEGRQGPGSRTLLASPLTAAAAAVTGGIKDPTELM